MERKYILAGSPLALARCRASTNNGILRIWDSQAEIKVISGLQLRKQLGSEEPFPAGIPLEVDCVFYFDIPKSRHKQVHENDIMLFKPDIDNLLKFILDASNKVLFRDDSQIAILTSQKRYSQNPRTEFTIKTL